MANSGVGNNQESIAKFLESLQADLKVLSSETKKKYPQIKEVSENLFVKYFTSFHFYITSLSHARKELQNSKQQQTIQEHLFIMSSIKFYIPSFKGAKAKMSKSSRYCPT